MSSEQSQPAIILVAPQMGENIGAAARAMMNCGLRDLRLVNPRDGWPNERATANAVGALEKMPPVKVFENTKDAIADCHFVLATTARPRDMTKQVFTAKSAATETHNRAAEGQKTAILFGAERAGLDNDDVALSHGIITVPLNPEFTSLNLGQGVLLVTYEWFQTQDETAAIQAHASEDMIATGEELNGMLDRLETELENRHFFRTEGHKPIMKRNIRNMLSRAELTEQEVRTMQGMISALIGKKSA